jgi:GDP-L-fucose synthase
VKKKAKIYVAGHRGLVGSAIVRALEAAGYENIVVRTHDELDLKRQAAVESFFHRERPEYMFLGAAKVGGIMANFTYPAEFIYDNTTIQTNVIHAAYQAGVKRLLFMGSSCIYPRECPQPMKEEHLLTGPLEQTNQPYALAKIAGIIQCEAYNRQYGTRYLAVMPTNLYGPNDNYDLLNSHVLPALIRKYHLAKLALQGDWDRISREEAAYGTIPHDVKEFLAAISRENGCSPPRDINASASEPAVVLWGTGAPRREFLHADDLAEACLFAMNLPEGQYDSLLHPATDLPLVNIGCGTDNEIRELAAIVADVVGYAGRTVWDTSKPDGTPQKLLDVSRLQDMGWSSRIGLAEGIKNAYGDYAARIS